MKYYYQDQSCTIYHGDARDILPELDPVDLVFTSPPYWQQRKYEMESFDWIDTVAKTLPQAQDKGNTQILVNLGMVHIDGEVFPYWNYLIDEMKAKDWRWFGQYVWDKLNGLPGNWNGRFAPSFEYLFHFNRSAVELNKTVETKGHTSIGTGLRREDGTMSGVTSPDKVGQPFKIPDCTIRMGPQISRGGFSDEHPATFPVEFPKFIISAFPAKTILDPFAGSFTTCRAAKDLNKHCIGIELEEKYCEIGAKRMMQEVLPLFP